MLALLALLARAVGPSGRRRRGRAPTVALALALLDDAEERRLCLSILEGGQIVVLGREVKQPLGSDLGDRPDELEAGKRGGSTSDPCSAERRGGRKVEEDDVRSRSSRQTR